MNELAKATLHNDPAQAEKLGSVGREYAVQNLEKEIVLAEFAQALESLNTKGTKKDEKTSTDFKDHAD